MTDPMGPKKVTLDVLIERFHQRYTVDENGCWVWNQSVTTAGYPQWSVNGKHVTVHRWAQETFNGPIPDGMHACHKCDVKRCVNPEHLESGTPSQNSRDALDRGLAVSWEAERTHCIRGHELPEKNYRGRRECKPCEDSRRTENADTVRRQAAERNRRYRARKTNAN